MITLSRVIYIAGALGLVAGVVEIGIVMLLLARACELDAARVREQIR